MAIDKLFLAGVRGSDPETGMSTFNEFLCVRASDYDAVVAQRDKLAEALRHIASGKEFGPSSDEAWEIMKFAKEALRLCGCI